MLIKTLQKVNIEGTYLSITKAIYDKPTGNIILNCEKLNAFFPKISNKTRMPILVLFNILLEHSSQRRKTIRWNSNWKRRSKSVTVYR